MNLFFQDSISLYKYEGGSLSPFSRTYVKRTADTVLYRALKRNEYCYIFNARQMGKSSLRKATSAKLQQENIACGSIDLSLICGSQTTEKKFYESLFRILKKDLNIDLKCPNHQVWEQKRQPLPYNEQFIELIENVILNCIQTQVVIFFDEIDSLLTLPFSTDQFLQNLRGFYDKRSTPKYEHLQRLSFVCIGVTTPSDLMESQNSAPFNIGRFIELEDFKLGECEPLENGLTGFVDHPHKVMAEIIAWTGGQPLLTQKLCWLVTQNSPIPAGKEAITIEKIVATEIIQNWELDESPEHLKTIRNRILWEHLTLIKEPFASAMNWQDIFRQKWQHWLNKIQTSSRKVPPSTKQLLKLYQYLLKKGDLPYHANSREQKYLLISGLVKVKNGKLVVKNKIYRHTFTEAWIKDCQETINPRIHLSKWSVPLAGAMVCLCIFSLRSLSVLQGYELATYDHLLRRMPREKQDERIVVVGVNEQDIAYYQNISDQVLVNVIQKLTAAGAVGIGVDLARNVPLSPGEKALAKEFFHNERVIGVCSLENNPAQKIPPPPTLPPQRTAHISIEDDSRYRYQDYTVRRYELSSHSQDSPQVCSATETLGFMLAGLYLKENNIEIAVKDEEWVIDSKVIKRLRPHTGGYNNLDTRGNQILLRYRRTDDPHLPVPKLSFQEVLGEEFDPALVNDKVVLIGKTAVSAADFHQTPYGRMQGVKIHAHFVSQLLSAVEDDRALISGLPWGGDSFLILLCSFCGGAIGLSRDRWGNRFLRLSIGGVTIYTVAWYLFFLGIWLPLLPMLLSFIGTNLVMEKYRD